MPFLAYQKDVASVILPEATEPSSNHSEGYNAIGHSNSNSNSHSDSDSDTSCQRFRNTRRRPLIISSVLLLTSLAHVSVDAFGITPLPSDMFPSPRVTNACAKRAVVGVGVGSYRGIMNSSYSRPCMFHPLAFGRLRLERREGEVTPHTSRLHRSGTGTACSVARTGTFDSWTDSSTYLNSLQSPSSLSSEVSVSYPPSLEDSLEGTTTNTATAERIHKNNDLIQYQQQQQQQRAIHTTTIAGGDISITTVPVSNSSEQEQEQYSTVFAIDVPEGLCIGVKLSNPHLEPNSAASIAPSQIKSNPHHWLRKILHEDEVTYGSNITSKNSRTNFFLGRIAMRVALSQLQQQPQPQQQQQQQQQLNEKNECSISVPVSVETETKTDTDMDMDHKDAGNFTKLPLVSNMDPSILKDKYGRPQVPHGYIGSISHKKDHVVALVGATPMPMPADLDSQDEIPTPYPKLGIGVDIEKINIKKKRKRSIAKKILTPDELNDLGKLQSVTEDEEVLLRFSLKESVYKAMHPLINEFVGFQEAEIKPHEDGTATVLLNLESGKHTRFKEVQAHWKRIGSDFFLSSSKVILKDVLIDGDHR